MPEHIRQFDPETDFNAERDLFQQILISNGISLNLMGFGEFFRNRNKCARLNQLSVRFRQDEDEYDGAQQVVVHANLVGTNASPESIHRNPALLYHDFITVGIKPNGGDYEPASDDFSFEQFIGAYDMAVGLVEDREAGMLPHLADDLSHLKRPGQ